ncbi:MAG: alkene reductase [Longimicrobiales bacterium]|nr:alkene reductase [Longimicrobiales bacterium]
MSDAAVATASLLEPATLGRLTLKSRSVMAPMTRSRAVGNVPNEMMAEYYGERAGAGLIVTEGTSPSPHGLGYPRIPGLYGDAHVRGWRRVTEAVHRQGGRIFVQLMHTGRVAHPANLPKGGRVLAPSTVPLVETKMWVDGEGELEIPPAEAMSEADVRGSIEEYVHAARLAMEAGFDGVELHGANGYLIQQFLHPSSNRRSDGWGGSIEGRTRFALEVSEAVARAIGPDRVGIRISPYGVFNEMPHYAAIDETYDRLTRGLEDIGVVYIHVVDHSSMGAPDVPAESKDRIREGYRGTLILSGGYDFQRANEDLDAGRADLVAFGRPFLANPDLLERFRKGAELNEPRPDLFYTPGAEGYIDYPTL